MPKLKPLAWAAGLAVVAAGLAAGYGGLSEKRAVAAEAAPALAPAAPARILAEGRLAAYPGAEVTLSAEIAGTLARLPVQEKDSVRAGQVVAELKSDELRAALGEARARIEEAEADLRLAQSESGRTERLVQANFVSRQVLDDRNRNQDAARARLASARAAVKRYEAALDHTRLVSPLSGVVVRRHAHPGETVDKGVPVLTVADLSRTRIEAEIDEFDAGRIRLGDAVRLTAEGYGGQSWRGRVEEIPDAVMQRSLKPDDPGRPSDTRVLLVKIALEEPTPLKLGQRAEIEILPAAR